MGFISSSTTVTLTAYLTQFGRKMLLSGGTDDAKIQYFSLGDPDTNYNIAQETNFSTGLSNILETGFVPDLTGDYNGCIKSIADSINVNTSLSPVTNPISGASIVSNTSITDIRFFTGTSSSEIGTKKLNVIVNLDNMIQWLYYHSSIAFDTTARYNIFDSSLKSPFADFYNRINIVTTDIVNSLQNTYVTAKPIKFQLSATDRDLYKKMSRAYVIGANGATVLNEGIYPNLTGGTYNTPQYYTYDTSVNLNVSPLIFAFSSDNALNSGAGKGGVSIYDREYGYVVGTLGGSENEISINNLTPYTFYSYLTEGNTSFPDTTNYRPAVRIIDNNTGKVYIEPMRNRNNFLTGSTIGVSHDVLAANQHMKLFNKNLIFREITNLIQFITYNSSSNIMSPNIFNKVNYGSYSEYRSKPITFVATADGVDDQASLTITFKYRSDATTTYYGNPNPDFITYY